MKTLPSPFDFVVSSDGPGHVRVEFTAAPILTPATPPGAPPATPPPAAPKPYDYLVELKRKDGKSETGLVKQSYGKSGGRKTPTSATTYEFTGINRTTDYVLEVTAIDDTGNRSDTEKVPVEIAKGKLWAHREEISWYKPLAKFLKLAGIALAIVIVAFGAYVLYKKGLRPWYNDLMRWVNKDEVTQGGGSGSNPPPATGGIQQGPPMSPYLRQAIGDGTILGQPIVSADGTRLIYTFVTSGRYLVTNSVSIPRPASPQSLSAPQGINEGNGKVIVNLYNYASGSGVPQQQVYNAGESPAPATINILGTQTELAPAIAMDGILENEPTRLVLMSGHMVKVKIPSNRGVIVDEATLNNRGIQILTDGISPQEAGRLQGSTRGIDGNVAARSSQLDFINTSGATVTIQLRYVDWQ